MKKTLIALLALGGMAMADSDLTYVTTVTKGTNAYGGYYGGCFNLTNSNFASNDVAFGEATTVMLDSVTFTAPSGGSSGPAKLAVYKYTGDNTTGTFVGLSTNSVTWSAGAALTFNFEGQEITTGDRYQYLFVNTSSTADDVASFDGYKDHATTFRVVVGNQTGGNLPGGWGTYKSSNINSWEGQYLTHAVVTTHTVVVPEPATATLSLLALAGLAARRRSH